MSVKIFFSYAHEDEPLLKKLKSHLKPLQRQGYIDLWHDRDINGGSEWEQEIDEHLNIADIILLLVSPDFMNSDYCYSIELKRAMERHNCGEALVIPIILRPVYWQEAPFNKLQVLPTGARPVTKWRNRDDALYDVAEGILGAMRTMLYPLSIPQISTSNIADSGLQKAEEIKDVYSRLLEERIVFIGTPIDENVASLTIAQLLFLQSKDATKDINLYINSPGGVIYAGLAIVDTISWLKPHVSTVCVGMAMGMAAIVLASGTKGKRYGLPGSAIMLRSSHLDKQQGFIVKDVEIMERALSRLDSRLQVMLAYHTEQTYEQIALDMKQTLILTANEAVSYGIIDEVLMDEP